MITMQSSNVLRPVNNKSTLFTKIGSTALDKVTIKGLAGNFCVRLSDLLQVCAHLYETGAILGRTKQDKLLELMSMSFAPGDMRDCLKEVRNSLRRRLETSGRYAHSFYMFYLYGTLRDMDMDFKISTMKAIRSDIRDKTEVGDFMERAGTEGLLLGGRYPDLVEKMYGREYRVQKAEIEEMIKGSAILPEETASTSIREREQVILSKVRVYVCQYHPNITDTLD